jgi:hypothetical protein
LIRGGEFLRALEKAEQSFGMGSQQLFATQITDDAVAGTALIPVGLDQTDVLINLAVGTLDLGGAEIHYVYLSMIGTVSDNTSINARYFFG